MKKETATRQKSRVLDFIRTHGKITSLDAFATLGITRLSARIFDLRKDGHNIKTRDVESDGVYGRTTYAEYYISRGRKPNPSISSVTYHPTSTTKVRVSVRRKSDSDRAAIKDALKGRTRKEVIRRLASAGKGK